MKFLTKISALFIFCLFAVLLVSFTACQTDDIMKKVIGTTWIRSFEDDKNGTEAYRPETYEFPPARGREGWKFEEDGTLKKQAIAATDGYVGKEGTWTFSNENNQNIIHISLKDIKSSYEIISVSDSILFVKPVEDN
ncbi:hypothetical protein WAF17_07350 [Bernardetia sp. ABR2-2B]|uniref:hypothetical protein n=1 Tax=Bernardetia sp. ABR2-2B TaxID=3127472 RepID=UPI0030D0421D